ncbi:MAG: aminoglycoside phosphotransferase family protein [Myxococcaceae bacterium]|nr:aminoglycoside phosphotransferase family protein [Myxococcaceae bacterium]
MSFALPAGVARWLQAGGFTPDAGATLGIASSRNLTLVARRRRARALVKVAATPDDPWSAREAALLSALGGGGPGFVTPTVLVRAPGRLVVSWLAGETTYVRRRRRRSLGAADDALVGRALAHLHARGAVTTTAATGELIERLLWTTPADYAAMSPATLALWSLVQHRRTAERTLSRLLAVERRSPAVLCHGDLRQANVFVARGRVGFVDLELSGLGDPARDLGMWIAEDLGGYLVPRDRAEILTLGELRRRLRAFVGAWERQAQVLGLPGVPAIRRRATAWAGEALLRRAYTVTVHEGVFGVREAHVARSALGLLTEPGRWARHFLGAA